MSKIPEKILEWRRRQKKGAIMKPSTFKKIARSLSKKAAGAAYWRAVRKKYRNRRRNRYAQALRD